MPRNTHNLDIDLDRARPPGTESQSQKSYSIDSATICPPDMSWYPEDRFPGKCEPDPKEIEKWKKNTRF